MGDMVFEGLANRLGPLSAVGSAGRENVSEEEFFFLFLGENGQVST